MHTKSWAELLKHFLCLFIFIDLACGIVYIVSSQSCMDDFMSHEILPIRLPVPHAPIEISVNLMFTIISSFGFSFFLIALCGLVGICCLSSRDVINFTFGVMMVMATFFDFAIAHSLTVLLNSYDNIIEGSIVELFHSANTFNVSKHKVEIEDDNPMHLKKSRKNNPYAIYNLNFTQSGWSQASEGGHVNQTHVDFLQFNLICCGLTGRHFWDMRIPRSCCSNRYMGERCVLSVAYSKSCVHEYQHFRKCSSVIRSEFICFGIIALLTAMDSLYLAYLRVQFPDGDYKSDKSSDEEEQDGANV